MPSTVYFLPDLKFYHRIFLMVIMNAFVSLRREQWTILLYNFPTNHFLIQSASLSRLIKSIYPGITACPLSLSNWFTIHIYCLAWWNPNSQVTICFRFEIGSKVNNFWTALITDNMLYSFSCDKKNVYIMCKSIYFCVSIYSCLLSVSYFSMCMGLQINGCVKWV